ncbi:FAD-dependent oxidoreductase [Neolewinella aurantiaca]|uniref:Tryptophan 2-monooxygenase n=1 Tax=Neolewinella aurantiaca TaxID=2602767 RepID=A0A5C7FCF4_9BACT|nr:FAD-dependent oxidoreductase [Neolewinella aurantiaca]TXF87812.1 FAD-dependent oxidoreductase [Neolewinella aurantiaca]
MQNFKDLHVKADYDIAIVGAGIAGLYTAYRLIENDDSLKIAIFERLNRTGGRLDSDIIRLTNNGELATGKQKQDVNTIKEEQGGMRFNDSMKELMNLIRELNLENQIVPFPMKSEVELNPGADPVNTNRFFFRGRGFSVADAAAGNNTIWGELYDIEQVEKNLDPNQIIANAFNRILKANDWTMGEELSADQWTEVREKVEWKGKTLNRWHIWGLLRDMGYSEECIRMLADTTGFPDTFKAFTNAGGAFQLLADFPKNPVYNTFIDGFSTLPDAIVDKISDRVSIFLSTNLNSLHEEEHGFELRLSEAEFGQNATPFSKETKSVCAKQIVIATAVKGIQDIFYKSPALFRHAEAPKLWEAINEVEGAELMKINLYFKEAWWLNGMTGRPEIQFGGNFTTLPLNAIYPFYAIESLETEQGKVSLKKSHYDRPAALTLYTDFSKSQFWEGLQNITPSFSSDLQTHFSDAKVQKIFPATQAVVDEMMKQLGLLFGATNLPEPIMTSYRAWNGKDDFEYAYHQWKLNAEDSKTRAYLSKPYKDRNLYFCNEAISDMQAWVNGSLRSADLALAHFRIEPLPDEEVVAPTLKSIPTEQRRQGFGGVWG